MTHPVIVISHALWSTHFAGDSGAIGRTVRVSGLPYTVIGVAPPEFHGVFAPVLVDAWVPLMMQQQLHPNRDVQHDTWLWAFGRLRDGVRREAARAELAGVLRRYIDQRTEPKWCERFAAVRLTEMDGLPADAHAMALGFIGLLMGASVLVLLIASVNVASMLSARAIARQREMAVRAALGAGRGRLVRQLLTEVVVLFVLGGAGGIAARGAGDDRARAAHDPGATSRWCWRSPPTCASSPSRWRCRSSPDLVFGLAPALRAANTDLNARLRDGTSGAGTRRRIVGNALIVGQLALSLVLLVSAGLFLRALDHGTSQDPGFDPDGVLTASINTESFGYDAQKGRAFYVALRERLAAIPGVSDVALTGNMPLAFATSNGNVWPDGQDEGREGGREADPAVAGERGLLHGDQDADRARASDRAHGRPECAEGRGGERDVRLALLAGRERARARLPLSRRRSTRSSGSPATPSTRHSPRKRRHSRSSASRSRGCQTRWCSFGRTARASRWRPRCRRRCGRSTRRSPDRW